MHSQVFNEDCLAGMKQYKDKAFDLAIVDPVYGGVTLGGYMTNCQSTAMKARAIDYNTTLWKQEKTPPEYFAELFRVSKNQIIWGGELLYRIHKQRFTRVGCLG